MIISANKTTLGNKNFQKRGTYYTKGKYCIYSANTKGKALEAIVDSIASSGVFVFEDLKNKEIVISYVNNLKNSIVFNIEDNFTWDKFNSILKTILIKERINTVFIKEDSEIKEKIDKKINLSFVPKKVFLRKYKRAKKLETQKVYIMKDIFIGLVLIGIFFFQAHFFENVSEENNKVFYKARSGLNREIRKTKIDIDKTRKLIKEMPYKVANNYMQIVQMKKGAKK